MIDDRFVALAVALVCLLAASTVAATFEAIELEGGFDAPGGPAEPIESDYGRTVGSSADDGDGGVPVVFRTLPIDDSTAASAERTADPPTGVAVAALVLVLAGIVGIGYRFTRGESVDRDGDETGTEDGDDCEVASLARGDRIREPSNDVVRAWLLFARSTVPDPERRRTRTPGEIQRRAIGNGYDRTSVRELTGLFRDVQYGPIEADPRRERRAAALLTRIAESNVGEGDSA
ncbi:DUF4129 domain-containing protein [Halopiger aswanensis]|uniref:Uncharacterized protein DUF4129 n=1 Tax=Halopiger aswanensis TaxID=148449 RepID=A0A419WIF0_9EURY|nr:DUF4129 domain-containing protein [Halopiger aswanensis]RKD95227.1 uncharacterized protein DUF4129 [Halopiger aswanensis]